MKTRSTLAVALALALAVPALDAAEAATVTLDFDDLTSGTVVGGIFADEGVTFSNATVTGDFSEDGMTLPNGIFHSISGTTVPSSDPIVAVFDAPVSRVALDAISVGAAGVLFEVFSDAAGSSLIDSITVIGTGTGLNNFVPLEISDPGIRRVEFSQAVSAGDGALYDNFEFDTAVAPVPLPAALPLFIAALAGLGALRWRRRAARPGRFGHGVIFGKGASI